MPSARPGGAGRALSPRARQRGCKVFERLPHYVKVLVRRRIGLTEVKLRGEGCAEHAEAVHDGERTDGEVSEAGLGHLSIYQYL